MYPGSQPRSEQARRHAIERFEQHLLASLSDLGRQVGVHEKEIWNIVRNGIDLHYETFRDQAVHQEADGDASSSASHAHLSTHDSDEVVIARAPDSRLESQYAVLTAGFNSPSTPTVSIHDGLPTVNASPSRSGDRHHQMHESQPKVYQGKPNVGMMPTDSFLQSRAVKRPPRAIRFC